MDNNGAVAACFYDRRNDPENFFIERFCAVSNDAGATWKNKRITERSFAPFHATDRFINPTYMGDYDSLAGDFTQSGRASSGPFRSSTSEETRTWMPLGSEWRTMTTRSYLINHTKARWRL